MYQAWWRLHLRVAQGENLSEQEHAHYLAIRNQLEREEILFEDRTEIERLQKQLAQAEIEREQLRGYRLQLEAKLAEMEHVSAVA